MDEELIATLVAVGIILLVSFPVHEFSHALAAFRLGDSTARFMGRLTLDPRVHFDPIGGGMLVLSALLSQGGFAFGFAKPTPVNPSNLDGGRRGEALVALAGPASNLVMAALAAIPLRFLLASDELLAGVLATDAGSFVLRVAIAFVVINAALFIFNLLPIPPLDGWKVLMGLIDARTAYSLRQVEQYGILLLLALVFFGGSLMFRLVSAVAGLLLGRPYG